MKKYRVGYTAGVFDLFHIGHLNILRKAKEQCDYLIVGVSTDEVVLDYKQKKPIIPFEERIAIVESIKYVDEAVPQTSRDKLAAWKKFKFNALFVGDDWKGTNLYDDFENKLNEVGVDLIYFPYTTGTSSTILGNVIQTLLSGKGIEET